MDGGKLHDRILGCLLGGIIGDAMGAPAEGKSWREVEEKLGAIEDFQGEGTDDSAIRQILCEAILEGGGRVTADEFAASFLKNKARFYKLFYVPVRNMFHKVESGLCLPVNAGIGNMHSSSSAMCISPMGILNAGNPRQAAIETFDVAGLIHAGDSGFCRDGACAMAAAVAEALASGATVDSVLQAATAYLHPKSAAEMKECIDTTLEASRRTGDYRAFREWFYRERLRDIVSDSRETVPCALALFSLARGKAEDAIPFGARMGRDADTIGTMVGGLAGAFGGVGSLKPAWIDRMQAALPRQSSLADAFCGLVAGRCDEARRAIARVEGMLGA
jgi:ADP-ribosylglycohydrolase